jgi:hypothetical protein
MDESSQTNVKAADAPAPPVKGGILAALRRSPMVGADIDVTRDKGPGRKINL